MKFLVIAQDMRVSGTSEGIVSRSFVAKLRLAYPESIIDVLYLKNHPSEDRLDLLPINSIETHIINLKPPFITKWLNRFSWRLFNISLYDRFVHKSYGVHISKVNHESYDHVFIRSSGLNFETVLGAKDLPILKKAIINFHDPYPSFWYAGAKCTLTNMELFRLKEMHKVVSQARVCMSPSQYLSEDMSFLYGSRKKFYTLPHQFCSTVFELSDTTKVLKKNRKVTLSYQGGLMFGRDIEVVLDAYQALVFKNDSIKENTEFALRVKTSNFTQLSTKYKECQNIIIMDSLNFSNSCYEQMYEADINIILENGPIYSNTLVGKAPLLASFSKSVFVVSPERSELRQIIKNPIFIANMWDISDVQLKLEALILDRLYSNESVQPFKDYFSDANFKKCLKNVLMEYN
ncbi:hypothetical protein H4V97_001358 [Flavobacterium sp. CG_23.5]|uniref:hypothetical protein n=1 Tax=Flavobacterium sp. CG_23.5 TaxID=2760708 RepID=UPI001AE41C41|nr:hypothetical protein [Flavobacterium sp. CG_23.5]MBP2283040.1 hypothetical protein [Flavobacterium sp. CG_23.5]